MEDYRDEADEAEDLEHPPDIQSPEMPEADALEQSTAVDPAADDRAEQVGDAPEGDTLDQHRPVSGDEEDDERR